MSVDFLVASSYLKTYSSGKINLHADLREDIRDKHLLLVEDIIDTGPTMKYIREMLLSGKPASLGSLI